jgi:hypothetical protein
MHAHLGQDLERHSHPEFALTTIHFVESLYKQTANPRDTVHMKAGSRGPYHRLHINT